MAVGTNAFINVNKATTPAAKVATYEYLDGGGNAVQSEAVTLTDSNGNELLGQQPMVESVPVVIASDQSPVPVTSVPATLELGHETAVLGVAVEVLAANPDRQWCLIQNTGTNNIRVGPAGVGLTTGLRLLPNGTMTINQLNPYQGALYAIAETGASIALAMEAD